MADAEKNILGTNTVCQIAIVVRDVETTAAAFADVLGVPVPDWRLTGPQEESKAEYRGKPTEARAKLAFFQMANLSIELIEPVGGPSTWQAFLDEHGEGVHHIAFRVADMPGTVAELAGRDMPAEQTGEFPGGRYAYIDSRDKLGVVLELLGER